MRNQRVIVLLTSLGMLGVASAAEPAGPSRDSVQVTVTAGKGRLGVSVLQISPELRTHFGAPSDRGVMIDAITAESPAARAGLRVGDVMVEVDGEPTETATDVLAAMRDRKKGETIEIAVVRARQRTKLQATLADDPGPVWHRHATRIGGRDALDPQMRRWFDEVSPFGQPGAQRELEETRKRFQSLERRLQRLEKQ